MKNIHILPTDKPSRLAILHDDKLHLGTSFKLDINVRPQNIYITSNEEIKEGDWFFNGEHFLVCSRVTDIIIDTKGQWSNIKTSNKIILTTDQDLIKDGVQKIDDDFLEWFVKNPSCEEVKVVEKQHFEADKSKRKNPLNGVYYSYKIIIPKEELTISDEAKQRAKNYMSLKGALEPKQETLGVKRNYEKHSLTKTKGYKLWCNIIQRCYNPKNHSYKYYGEKGVIMEDYFKNSYENFINWIKGIANYEKWLNSSELSLDRIDNTLGYVRGNIKFSTKTEQVENQNLRLDNKSGYKGVCYHKLNKKYGATITINKSKVFLGYYDTALEAALVYDNYVLKNNLNRKTNL